MNAALTPAQLRALCRAGRFSAATSGYAPGYQHANLMILPQDQAFDFLLFAQRNTQACPLLEVLEAGRYEPDCAPQADLRSDLPGYRVFRNGQLDSEVSDIRAFWRDDLVSFLIGCSFSFEAALMAEGIELHHVAQGRNVAMYNTNIACRPAGRLTGNLVVSMRPIQRDRVDRVRAICRRFPLAHGEPIHVGSPQAIGIVNLARPDYGDAVGILPDEVPVFWCCGVTPQAVALASHLPFCLTHAPGKMLVTDLKA